MTDQVTTLDFTDVETTGLNPNMHEVWEVAIVQRVIPYGSFPGKEDLIGVWQFRPLNLQTAEPKALEINRFHDRFVVPFDAEAVWVVDGVPHPLTRSEAVEDITWRLMKAVMIGSNTAFDATFIRKLIRCAPWHYRVVNALELAAGVLLGRGEHVEIPWNSYEISRRIGIEPPAKGVGHTALADALWARDVFDKLGVSI